MTEIPKEAFPLTWPASQQRTPRSRRKQSAFKLQFGQARDELLAEIRRMVTRNIIISTDAPLRRDGLPYADKVEPPDPGVAVYFERYSGGKWKPYVIACDTYHRLRFNMRAVGVTIEALRAIERHGGSQLMEQAFTGFAQLPGHICEPSWWDTLGVSPEASMEQIDVAYEALARTHHPDAGGDHEQMARINKARDSARAERQ